MQPERVESQIRKAERPKRVEDPTGGNDGEVPPVPIPNTAVKLSSAESTWLDTAREDRSLPVPHLSGICPTFIFLSSSMAEHPAVNRVVVGSSPTWGAQSQSHQRLVFSCI